MNIEQGGVKQKKRETEPFMDNQDDRGNENKSS